MSKTRPEWSQEITMRADDLVALRRDFHRHPELSHQERRTAEIIAERLHAAKLDVRTAVGGTGVVGVLHGEPAGTRPSHGAPTSTRYRSPSGSRRPSPPARRA